VRKTFVEQMSSVAKTRPQLEAAIDIAREGDEFVTAKMDRLARSVEDLIGIESAWRRFTVAAGLARPQPAPRCAKRLQQSLNAVLDSQSTTSPCRLRDGRVYL
jgi:hypothetical protein